MYALARQPSAIVSSTLTKTVLVTNYYYRIRVEAALALVTVRFKHLTVMATIINFLFSSVHLIV